MELDTLKKELIEFFGHGDFDIQTYQKGASVRNYFKLNFAESSYFPEKEIILMKVPTDRIEIADDYLNISYYLRRNNVHRPRVYEYHRKQGWIFLSPASGLLLKDYISQNPAELEEIFRQLLNYLIDLQNRLGFEKHCPAFKRWFDEDKYLFEINFHLKEQLIEKFYSHKMNSSAEAEFEKFSVSVSKKLHSDHPVFVHRDFQSSNIFYDRKNPDNPFQIIDFQDARSGSFVYDLVSLLWDSYLTIDENLRGKFIDYFFAENELLKKNISREEYDELIKLTVIQRKFHDAGAFVYSERLTGNSSYLKYISPAIEMAMQVLAEIDSYSEIYRIFSDIFHTNQ